MMSAAARAMIFRARHPELIVFFKAQRAWTIIPEAWPAGAAIIFRVTVENGEIAAGAMEDTLALFVIQRGRKRPLGRLLSQDPVGERREPVFPFRIRKGAPFTVSEFAGDCVSEGFALRANARTGRNKGCRGAEEKGAPLQGEESCFCHAR